ncbi:hypothetical protein EV186_1184 [Labedaea rhizosphaerae]|uniref:Uncharacterized protein n=1 Tax=Labedaea rhizosphaerae TaxID=598644 RepID=A0A4V3CX53_LABRH|nr:hypothetical protein EV186_1184 [Labedaea rhizosphaerae]
MYGADCGPDGRRCYNPHGEGGQAPGNAAPKCCTVGQISIGKPTKDVTVVHDPDHHVTWINGYRLDDGAPSIRTLADYLQGQIGSDGYEASYGGAEYPGGITAGLLAQGCSNGDIDCSEEFEEGLVATNVNNGNQPPSPREIREAMIAGGMAVGVGGGGRLIGKLSDPLPGGLSKKTVAAYEEIRAGRGTLRLDSVGNPTVFQGRRPHERFWRGAVEYDVPVPRRVRAEFSSKHCPMVESWQVGPIIITNRYTRSWRHTFRIADGASSGHPIDSRYNTGYSSGEETGGPCRIFRCFD